MFHVEDRASSSIPIGVEVSTVIPRHEIRQKLPTTESPKIKLSRDWNARIVAAQNHIAVAKITAEPIQMPSLT